VCCSLVGYASGFASACLGKEIYFRETSCIAQGATPCAAIGRDAESWGPEMYFRLGAFVITVRRFAIVGRTFRRWFTISSSARHRA
jgi:hypothetical protein